MLTDRDAPAFDVHLDTFTGPFDLLLGLISRRRLELTEVSLAAVTDEFVAHLRRMLAAADAAADDGDGVGGGGAALGQASGFLVVAATLLDLKAARLLPSDEAAAPDAEDLAVVEARDLLFARLLQHRAYAQVGALLRDRLERAARSAPRPGGARTADPTDALGAAQARALAELVLGATPEQLAALAAQALTAGALAAGRGAGPAGQVDVEHLHVPAVSVPEQVALLRERLAARDAARPGAAASFTDLLGHGSDVDGGDGGDGDDDGAGGGGVPAALVVGRFLAVLELYRRGEVDLAQPRPQDPLEVTWRGGDGGGGGGRGERRP